MPLLRLGHQSVFKIVLGTDVGIENAQDTQKQNGLDFVHSRAHGSVELSQRKWFRAVHYHGAQNSSNRTSYNGFRFAATRVV